jgi:hypothetical protein
MLQLSGWAIKGYHWAFSCTKVNLKFVKDLNKFVTVNSNQ